METCEYTIKELKELLSGREVGRDLILKLKEDPRKGVQKLAEKYQKKREQEKERAAKYEQMAREERSLWEDDIYPVAGLDEAGRGPLAGPVVAAAVILEPEHRIIGLDDSKKISPARREALFKEIKEKASVGIGRVGPQKIDEINILQASFLAMRKALDNLEREPEYLLIDGKMNLPQVNISQEAVINGDSRVNAVAAASIAAKVTRDRIMLDFAEQYPEYNFSANMGYGTAEHIEVLREYGVSPIHRSSFKVVAENQQSGNSN